MFDWVKHAVGETSQIQAHFQIQRPTVRVRDPNGTAIIETVESDVPDLIAVAATLEASSTVQKGATLQARFRRGQPFPGQPSLWWTINGEKGEIRLTSPVGTALHAAGADSAKIELHDFETDEVEQVEWAWADWQEGLPPIARSVGAAYEALADGKVGVYPTFEDALALHEQLESTIAPFYA